MYINRGKFYHHGGYVVPFLEFLLPRSFLSLSSSSIFPLLCVSAPTPCSLLSPPLFSCLFCLPLYHALSFSPPFNFLSPCIPQSSPHFSVPISLLSRIAILPPSTTTTTRSIRRTRENSSPPPPPPPSNRQRIRTPTYNVICSHRYRAHRRRSAVRKRFNASRPATDWTRPRAVNEVFVLEQALPVPDVRKTPGYLLSNAYSCGTREEGGV